MSTREPDLASEAQSDLLAIVSRPARRNARWPWLLVAATGVAIAAASAAHWMKSRWTGTAGPASIAMSLDTPERTGAQGRNIISSSAAAQDTAIAGARSAAGGGVSSPRDSARPLPDEAALHATRDHDAGHSGHVEHRSYAYRWHGSSPYARYRKPYPGRATQAELAQTSAPHPAAAQATVASARAPVASPAATDESRRSALDRYQKQVADAQAATAAYAADQAAYQQELARSRKAQDEYDKVRPRKDR